MTHKELLTELVEDWTIENLDHYLLKLRAHAKNLDDWIRHVENLRRSKAKKLKQPVDTGARDGR